MVVKTFGKDAVKVAVSAWGNSRFPYLRGDPEMTFISDLDAQWRRLCDGTESRQQVERFLVAVAAEEVFADYDTSSLPAVLGALHAPAGESEAYDALADRVRCLIRLAQVGEQVAELALIQSFIGVVWRDLGPIMSRSGDRRRGPDTDDMYAWYSEAVAALWEKIHAFDLDSATRPVAALSWVVRSSIRKNRREWLRLKNIECHDPREVALTTTGSEFRVLGAAAQPGGGLSDVVSPARELLRSMRHQEVITDHEYQIVSLHDLDGWKMTEIAHAHGTTAATTRQRRHRALQRLRRHATPDALVG